MPSRFYIDADLIYFAKHLQNKARGRAYIALYKRLIAIEERIKLAAKNRELILVQLRRDYIGVSDLCSLAIKELERADHWPP